MIYPSVTPQILARIEDVRLASQIEIEGIYPQARFVFEGYEPNTQDIVFSIWDYAGAISTEQVRRIECKYYRSAPGGLQGRGSGHIGQFLACII